MVHQRALSFSFVDHAEASGVLADVLHEADVFLGGSSVGKGFKKAAHYYLSKSSLQQEQPGFLHLPGAADLTLEAQNLPTEEAFYVVDIGVVVSQLYQWRRYLPRVEPFYAVKCNSDPVIVKTLAVLGCNFDCASRNEIQLVQELSQDLPRTPDIIYANPCKAPAHLLEAVCKGVRLVTFDNATEVVKCAAISKKIELILRIITDDRGSQCRLSTKFGAPKYKWRPLLAAAKQHGLPVVGVSFHVGSGCRDASRYQEALKDAREIFDIADKEFNMKMRIIDIGGGFPGETHSMWNTAIELDDDEDGDGDIKDVEGKSDGDSREEERFMTFHEIAEQVAPMIDEIFPPESGVRVIAEPGRYLSAACATLCCSVVAARSNEVDTSFNPEPVDDRQASMHLNDMTREEEDMRVQGYSMSLSANDTDDILNTIQEELSDYTKLFAAQQLAQQEVDVYNDAIDLYDEQKKASGMKTASDLLGPPTESQRLRQKHTVEGMSFASLNEGEEEGGGMITLAAAGEAAVNGLVLQAVADSAPLQDDYAYYINDGVYSAFNNLMFDHATVRPRVLRGTRDLDDDSVSAIKEDGFRLLQDAAPDSSDDEKSRQLYASTVFGPTCDSIDVIARSVLLPKLKVGDWLYFQNMGAYTMAAASNFNGFTPSAKFYVCSVMPEYFEALIKGPEEASVEEKKDD